MEDTTAKSSIIKKVEVSEMEETKRRRPYTIVVNKEGNIWGCSESSTLADFLEINIADTVRVGEMGIFDFIDNRLSHLDDISADLHEEFVEMITGKSPSFEYHGDFTIGDEERHIHIDGQRIVKGNYIMSFRDESDITHAKRDLEDALNAYHDAVGVVNHEMKTPVVAIDGILQHLQLEFDLNSKGQMSTEELIASMKRKIDRIEIHKDRLFWIIQKYIQLVKAESTDKIPVEDVAVIVPITEYIDSLEDKTRIRMDESYLGNEIVNMKDVRVESNRSVIFMVYANLTSNALKYSGKNGQVYLYCEDAGDNYRLSVLNTGSGISEEDKGKLFKRFSKLANASEGSTGLGLYNTRRFIEKVGGKIDVESDGATYTRFYFDLPKARKDNS